MNPIQKKQGLLSMEKFNYYVYMLECRDQTFYTGYTKDLSRRIKQHETGHGAKYTRGRGPFKVVYVEKFQTQKKAMQREYEIKQLTRKEKEELIDVAERSEKDEYSTELFNR